jgi:hypothetical protein
MKKTKYIVALLLLSLPILIRAQDSISRKGFYAGVVFSPDYSYRMLSPGGGPMDQSIISQRNGEEIPKLAFTAGINLLYQKSKRFAFSFGIQYSVKGESSQDIPVTFGAQIDPRNGFVYSGSSGGANVVSVSFKHQTTYLDLPLKVDYYLCTRRNAWYISGGIAPNIFLFEKVIQTEKTDNGSVQRSSQTYARNRTDYFLINPQAQLGFGFDRLIKSSRLRIEPVYRMSVWNVDEKGSIKGYFYSIGINCSYLFSLKK